MHLSRLERKAICYALSTFLKFLSKQSLKGRKLATWMIRPKAVRENAVYRAYSQVADKKVEMSNSSLRLFKFTLLVLLNFALGLLSLSAIVHSDKRQQRLVRLGCPL